MRAIIKEQWVVLLNRNGRDYFWVDAAAFFSGLDVSLKGKDSSFLDFKKHEGGYDTVSLGLILDNSLCIDQLISLWLATCILILAIPLLKKMVLVTMEEHKDCLLITWGYEGYKFTHQLMAPFVMLYWQYCIDLIIVIYNYIAHNVTMT